MLKRPHVGQSSDSRRTCVGSDGPAAVLLETLKNYRLPSGLNRSRSGQIISSGLTS